MVCGVRRVLVCVLASKCVSRDACIEGYGCGRVVCGKFKCLVEGLLTLSFECSSLLVSFVSVLSVNTTVSRTNAEAGR